MTSRAKAFGAISAMGGTVDVRAAGARRRQEWQLPHSRSVVQPARSGRSRRVEAAKPAVEAAEPGVEAAEPGVEAAVAGPLKLSVICTLAIPAAGTVTCWLAPVASTATVSVCPSMTSATRQVEPPPTPLKTCDTGPAG